MVSCPLAALDRRFFVRNEVAMKKAIVLVMFAAVAIAGCVGAQLEDAERELPQQTI